MSRGIGRCQRRIMDELTKSPSRTITRLDLDAVLVEGEGYDASNVLRSIRALTREHLVTFIDHRHKAASTVTLPPEIAPVNEDLISALLTEINEGVSS